MSYQFKTLRGALLYFGSAGYVGYSISQYQSTGMIGPIKTKRYSTIQHWFATGGGNIDRTYDEILKIEWLTWDQLPPEARQPEWFCWQRRDETIMSGLNWRRFVDVHIMSKKD